MIAVFLCFCVSLLDLNPSEIEHLIKAGLEHAYVEGFDSARFYFEEVVREQPLNPTGYFFCAALIQLKMMDECRLDEEKMYYEMMRKTVRLAEDILSEEDDRWARFYLANSYIYQAVYKGWRKDYFETFKLGIKGGRMMQELVREDSLFFDAYLAAGTFEYFWARASRYLPFLNIGGGDVQSALRKLHLAADKSRYSGPTARNSLAFIYGEEGEYEKAAAIVESLRAEYPASKTFLWSEADLEFKRRDYRSAADLYEDLYQRYDALANKNYANLAQCRLYVGKCLAELGEKDGARAHLKEVIRFKEHSGRYPQIKEYMREAYTLLNRLL
ncbi:tetratricopeptide repeat protein [candidate division WOR-3 bacterium]|nr:tetratricopeptide repeat protein [candidate division WOR-3 bacterium]